MPLAQSLSPCARRKPLAGPDAVNFVLRNPDVPQQMIRQSGKALPNLALLCCLTKPIDDCSRAAEQRLAQIFSMGLSWRMHSQRH